MNEQKQKFLREDLELHIKLNKNLEKDIRIL